MPRLELAFILCCCKSCLDSNRPDEESFYDLLGIDRDATQDEIKRAYKRQSLLMHPDKLAQKGRTVTETDQARFTRMKEAYEVLTDPHKRETYDTIGERGMKWIEEPFSIDPQEMAHNFSTSSTLDRSKIFAIFVAIAVTIFILPILVCLQVDVKFGPDAKWIGLLTPLWIFNVLLLLYHVRFLIMGPIPKPDHIPAEEWVDPLPMPKRLFSFLRFLLLLIFEILAALRLDDTIGLKWSIIFIPIFVLEFTLLYKVLPTARQEIVTFEELTSRYDKPFTEFTETEKEVIMAKYVVVPSRNSPEYGTAEQKKSYSQEQISRIVFRFMFFSFLLIQLDTNADWNWWFVFSPFWLLSLSACCYNLQSLKEAQLVAMQYEKMESGSNANIAPHYGAMEEGGIDHEKLSDAEREELDARVSYAGSRLMHSCCSQVVFLSLLSMITSKAQGAGYASLWIISPFLIISVFFLCCLGCAIFNISPIDSNDEDLDIDQDNSFGAVWTGGGSKAYVPPTTIQSAAEYATHSSHQPLNDKEVQHSVTTTVCIDKDIITIDPPQTTSSVLTKVNGNEPEASLLETTLPAALDGNELAAAVIEMNLPKAAQPLVMKVDINELGATMIETSPPQTSPPALTKVDESGLAVKSLPPPIDLLNDNPAPVVLANNDKSMVVPTRSEVDDLD